MISVVVLTLNEVGNLARCLASVDWADDILVLDSGSTDGTCELAKALGARVMQRPFDSFAGQRNFAMEAGELRHDWVLHLDADEEVPSALRAELQALVRSGDVRFPVWRVASRMIFMGRWLRHAAMYPAYQVRFGRADALRFVDFGHGQREVQRPEDVGTLREPLDHHNFSKGINDWLARHLRYAAAEAAEMAVSRQQPLHLHELFAADRTARRRALKRLSYRLPFRSLAAFVYVYVVRAGFLDGRSGYAYCRMYAMYHGFIGLNALERTAQSSSAAKAGDER